MQYIVYNTETTVTLTTKLTERAAKMALTKAVNAGTVVREDYAIATAEEFSKIEKMVPRTNHLTGETYMERVNTPYYMSPSSETYWSM